MKKCFSGYNAQVQIIEYLHFYNEKKESVTEEIQIN
jgi:hypothetical protein